MTLAFLGLGSNVGPRLEYLQDAVRRIAAAPGIEVLRSSRVYETEPVGGPAQSDFLNAVIEVETSLSVRDLLAECQNVERSLHRVRQVRWAPRTIDVDVLTFGDDTVEEPDLQVPHPRMHERGFVLVPLLELEPDPMLPGGRRLSELRLGPDVLSAVRPFAPPLDVGPG